MGESRWKTEPGQFSIVSTPGATNDTEPQDISECDSTPNVDASPVDETNSEALPELVVRTASLIEQLRANPLARLMPGSRELFHSNLLAWYFETMGEPAMRTLASLAGFADVPTAASRIERESNRFDLLVLDDSERGVVVENKVFSVPRTEQLDEYAVKLSANKTLANARPILLSLAKPPWLDGLYVSKVSGVKAGVTWHHVSYRRLAEIMRSSIPQGSDSYEWTTIAKYCDLVETLSTLAEAVANIDPAAYVFPNFPSSQRDSFANQIYGSLRKLRADAVAQYVAAELQTTGLSRSTDSGMSNSQPIVETFYRRKNTKRATAVGWQLQGNQLRLFANIPTMEGRTKTLQDRRVQWGNDHLELFSFDFIAEIFDGNPAEIKPAVGFNRFDPAFIYRYIDASELTIAQLLLVARAHESHLQNAEW